MRVLPPLDGGMLALIAIQVLTRKPIADYVQASLCKAGLGMMLVLSVLAFIFEMVPMARFHE
jgi:membrane-associated protease RseP (regulator of RpoE activity)